MDIKLTSSGIAMQKQIGSISIKGNNVFFNSGIDNSKVKITKENGLSIKNSEVSVQGIS